MDVPAAGGGERTAKVTPFDASSDDRDMESDSSLLTAASLAAVTTTNHRVFDI